MSDKSGNKISPGYVLYVHYSEGAKSDYETWANIRQSQKNKSPDNNQGRRGRKEAKNAKENRLIFSLCVLCLSAFFAF